MPELDQRNILRSPGNQFVDIARDNRLQLRVSMNRFLSVLGITKPSWAPSPPRLLRDSEVHESFFETRLLAVHTTIADVSVVASCVNYVAAGGRVGTLTSCEPYLPLPDLALHEQSEQATIGPHHLVQSHLVSLRRNCSLVAGATARLIDQAKATHGASLPKEALEACVRQWRTLAVSAVDTLNTLEPESRWRTSGKYAENALLLIRQLRQISDGRWPTVSESGRIEPVQLPQKRRVPRFELRETCRVHADDEIIDAVTINISAGGLGLKSRHIFPLWHEVKVQLKSGRRFYGNVTFVTDGRVGIQFFRDLPSSDPLLGAQAARG